MQHATARSLIVPGLLLVLLAMSASASAQTSSIMSFVPEVTELSCDVARPIDIWIDEEVTDLRGASLLMRFDPTVVRPVAVEEGQLFLDDPCPSFLRWNNATAIGDSVFVDVAGLGCSVQGPGPIVRIWVTGVADGSTLLYGVEAILRDGDNAPVDVLWTPAHIIVACPVRSDESTWSVLKSSFR